MLRSTFVHLPGIGMETERNLWKRNILYWEDFIYTKTIEGIGEKRKLLLDREIRQSITAYVASDENYFAHSLPTTEHWRAYALFTDETLCLDIEWDRHGITVVTLCNGVESKVLVRGVNLFREILFQALHGVKMLLTFNGGVDLYQLNKEFSLEWSGLHCDVRTVASRLGYKGGLKQVEKELGIKRTTTIRNGDPALLYRMWRGSGDEHYLRLLLDYNEADALHLYYIMQQLIGRMSVINSFPS